MAAELLGLVLNLWLLNPTLAVASLGNDDFNEREVSQFFSLVIGQAEGNSKDLEQPYWAIHVRYWQPFAHVQWRNQPWFDYRHLKGAWITDAEVRGRARLARQKCLLYGKGFLPGG